MTDRPNETSGTLPPRPDEAAEFVTSGRRDEPPPARAAAGPDGGARPGVARREPVRSGGGFGWIVVIVLILGGVAVSPWWAPALAPLLPWSARMAGMPQAAGAGEAGNAADRRVSALEQRLAGTEQQLTELAQRSAPAQSTASPAGADDAAKRRLDAIEKRLAEIDQQPAQPGQSAASDAVAPSSGATEAALSPLREAIQRQHDEVAALAGRVAALERRPAASPSDAATLGDLQSTTGKLGGALAALEQRVGTLASTDASAAAASVDPALLLSLGQLRQALQGSGPFTAELAAATSLATDRGDIKAALAPLGEAATRGVPSLAILRQRFDALSGSIAGAGTAPAAADDWSGQVLGKLRGLVTVRRVGAGVSGDGPEAVVAQAESALAGDDLAGAVAALETLHGPPMVAARDWLDAARRRLAAEAALGKATALVTARLAAERQPVTPAASGAKP